jgi:hypothetical protein
MRQKLAKQTGKGQVINQGEIVAPGASSRSRFAAIRAVSRPLDVLQAPEGDARGS